MRLKTEWLIIQMNRWYAGELARHPLTGRRAPDLLTLEELERTHVEKVLCRTETLGEAAEILGITQRALYNKREKYGLL